jgi:hypothetical protein
VFSSKLRRAARLGLLFLVPLLIGRSASGDDDLRIEKHRMRWERIETWLLRARVDFGPEDRVEPGSQPCDAMDWNPLASWSVGMVRAISRPEMKDPYLGDFIEGERATLHVAAESGMMYLMILTVGDADEARGPMRVQVDDRVLAESLVTAAGEFKDIRFQTRALGPKVTIRIEAAPCRSFAVNGLALYTEGAIPGTPRTRNAVPEAQWPATRTDADSLGERAQRALRRAADFLLNTQPPEGGFSRNGTWYECAYPVRTLLAASRIFHEPRYAAAALGCVDRFVAERLPGGGWSAHFFGTQGCPIAEATRLSNQSRNLADLGSMAVALDLSAGVADKARATRYLKIARAYADSIVLPAQLPSGAFPNGRFDGKDFAFPYSVATAVQATNLALLHEITGEARYRDASIRAALFLSRTIQKDGSVRLHLHDREDTQLLQAESVGDLFYVIESLLRAHRIADAATADTLAGALDRYFRGGSLATLWQDPRAWLRKGDTWERSKRAGMLYLLLGYAGIRGPSEDLDRLVHTVFGALEEPAFAKKLGVLADPVSPENRFSLGATGFAGIGIAALSDAASGRKEGD